ncbi:MAG: hypothetical protein E6Q97_15075 [Desulfurellales bacterium]|nr:MAG: hypothetical protein E6Q97_15075 [Desulfurellales bacterium]
MRKIAALLAIAAFAFHGFSATWYLDNAATGTGAGTSWVNAFTNPTQLTASVLAPGDTVFISGGTSGKAYTNNLTAVESGTASNPIKYRIGQDAGHNGVATFPAMSFETYQNIWFDGARNPVFIPAASVFNLNRNAANMGLRTTRTNGLGIYANGAGGVGNRVRWVEVGPHGTLADIGSIDGIRLLNMTSISNFVIEYCWIHDIQNDGINHNLTTVQPLTWGAMIVRDTLIERTGDDGIQWSCNGLTLYRCKLYDHWRPLYNGHPDQLQLAGGASSWIAVVNCILGNKGNSLIIGEHFITEGGFIGPMLLAGNVFANTRDWAWNDIQAYGVTHNAWRPNDDTSVNQGWFTNLYVLNNTVYYQSTTPFKFGRAEPTGGTRSVFDLRMQGLIANNLLIDTKYNTDTSGNLGIQGTGDPTGAADQVAYTTNDLPAVNNIVAGPNRSMNYHGVASLDAMVHGMGNGTNMPAIETNLYSFEIAGNDTVAKDKGFSLVALTNQFPELRTDLSGRPRGYDGLWDIGARDAAPTFSTNELQLWIKLDDDLSDGIATDSSPRQNHGKHFGYLASQDVSNRFPISMTWTNPLTDEVGGAGFFQRIRDDWGVYGQSGRYIGFTNLADFQSKSNVSVMAWIYYQPWDITVETNFGGASNPRWFSSGYAYRGGFAAGLFSSKYSAVRVYNADGANEDYYVGYNQEHFVSDSGNYQGYSTNWAHLGFTWNGQAGILITYLNGIPKATNSSLGQFPFTVRGPSGGLGSGFLMLGGDNHNGRVNLTPEDDFGDQYPNHAWFTGGMADFRLFTRVVPPEEMYVIPRGAKAAGDFSYGGGGGGGGEEGGGEGGSSTGKHSIRATVANVGRITGP